MGTNYYDGKNNRLYYEKDFQEKKLKIESPQKTIYNFDASVTGEFGDRKAYFCTGYNNNEENTNYYVLDRTQLKDLINTLNSVLDDIEVDNTMHKFSKYIKNELKRYIEKGYVESITVTKLDNCIVPNGFDSRLYKAFNIAPVFKKPVNELPNDHINLEFNYTEFMYISTNKAKFDELVNNIRFGHEDIPINWIGYDWNEEAKKYIKESMKELNDFDISKRKIPSPEDIKRAKEIMKNLGYKLPN